MCQFFPAFTICYDMVTIAPSINIVLYSVFCFTEYSRYINQRLKSILLSQSLFLSLTVTRQGSQQTSHVNTFYISMVEVTMIKTMV